MPTQVFPSFTDRAQFADESEAPSQWDKWHGGYAPELAVQGDQLTDVSPIKAHGTLVSLDTSAAWPRTERGIALQTDGVDGYVNCGTRVGRFTTAGFTAMCWVKLLGDGTTQFNKAAVLSCNQQSVSGWALAYNKLLDRWEAFLCRSGAYRIAYTANSTAVVGEWTHLTVAFDPPAWRIYQDGVAGTPGATAAYTPATRDLKIAAGWNSDSPPVDFFYGQIQNVRLYDRALSLATIKEIAADSLAVLRFRKGRSVTVPLVPGMEFTMPGNRVHYTMPDNRMHFTMPGNRMHYTMPEAG